MMKIRVLAPVLYSDALVKKALQEYRAAASPGTEVSVAALANGTHTIEADLDIALAQPDTMRLAVEAEADGIDACAVACFSDPGVAGADADACANLSIAHLNGIGVTANETKAAELGKRACEDKSSLGCAVYANALVSGRGAAKDVEAGAKLFSIACEGGNTSACVATGKCLYYGLGLPRDADRASTLLVAACDKGSGEACRLLADWSLAGHTPPVPSGALNPVMF
jgi:TPR repeat protein